MADIELDQNKGRAVLSRFKSSLSMGMSTRMGSLTRMGTSSPRSVHPSELGTGPSSKKAPGASRELAHGEAEAAAPSLARRSEAAVATKLLLAAKITHEELGEKTALFLGCAVAGRVGGLSSEWTVKVLALLLLEAVSDLAKVGVYGARKIEVGHCRFNLHWPSLLGVALLGGSSCALLLAAIGFNCLIGEDIASIFG
jgi:hypothetical protein